MKNTPARPIDTLESSNAAAAQPLVSVIIIFLNEEKFIEEAIESVLAQTYKTWELLLVDDGSTDRSTRIAREYADRYPGIVRYREHQGHEARGMSTCRNLGIREAKGDYIAFLDADDVWLPDKLEQQIAILMSRPEAAAVCGPVQWWYGWTGKPEDSERDCVVAPSVQPDRLFKPPELLRCLLKRDMVSTTTALVRHKVMDTLNGFEESFHGLYEDQVFFAKLCMNVPVYITSHCSYKWRKHSESCCSVAVRSGQYRSARLKFLVWLEKYLSEQPLKDRDVTRLLKRETWRSRHPKLNRIRLKVRNSPQQMKEISRTLARRLLPRPFKSWLVQFRESFRHSPPLGWVRFGSLRRIGPVNRRFGLDRGRPIDRYFIESFLSRHAMDIRGSVLEVANNSYTIRFGGDRVTRSDILFVEEGNPRATIVADLSSQEHHIPSESFDCIILTQTLQYIYDTRSAIETLYRILKPGGVVLATVPGISQISRSDMERWGEYWRFTSLSAKRLFEGSFGAGDVSVGTYGNVLAASAFLYGLVTEELRQDELEHVDPDYQMLVTVRATKG
jgi:glycosyltransferase involved in cell wall biosynthesis/SAM-dependent methyltransferase